MCLGHGEGDVASAQLFNWPATSEFAGWLRRLFRQYRFRLICFFTSDEPVFVLLTRARACAVGLGGGDGCASTSVLRRADATSPSLGLLVTSNAQVPCPSVRKRSLVLPAC